MGAVCCCLRPEYLDEYVNSNNAVYRNCICFRCFVQQFLSMYTAIFQRGEVHALPSPVQGVTPLASSGLGATSPDNSLPDTFRSPPRPLPYDVDPRRSRLQHGLVLRREKASSHCHEESEPLRSNDCETLGASGKWNGSDNEGGSKVCYSSYTSKMVTSVEAYILSSSEDEDVCPTCLEEYTTENPKIITQCSHHFHLGCIYEWMERSETCPVCGKVCELNSFAQRRYCEYAKNMVHQLGCVRLAGDIRLGHIQSMMNPGDGV